MTKGKNTFYSGRYEPISSEWVHALREYMTRELEGADLDYVACSFSAEFTDPPQHLLRGDGRSSVGYSFDISNGRLEVKDGASDAAAARVVADYAAVCPHYHLKSDEADRWAAASYPKIIAEGKLKRYGDPASLDNINKVIDIRNDFYALHSLPV